MLARSPSPSHPGNSDLRVYSGERFSNKTLILENEFVFGLAARGYLVGEYLVFCYVYGSRLQFLWFHNNMAAAPQGPQFFMSNVSPDEGFFSSDLLVTPDGDVLVLGYFAVKGSFQPRLFILPAAAAASPQGSTSGFEEIPLGLAGGVYYDGVFGHRRMRFAPEVIDGKVAIWSSKQFTSAESQIVLIEVDLEAALASPAGETPASPAVVETIVVLIAAAILAPNPFIETAAVLLGTQECPILGLLFLDDHWRLKIALIDFKTRETLLVSIDALNFKTDSFVSLGGSSGVLGGKYISVFNAGSSRYMAWGGGGHGEYYGWKPRFKTLKPIRSADNFGCSMNLCDRDSSAKLNSLSGNGSPCYNARGLHWANRKAQEIATQGEEADPEFGFFPMFLGTSLDVAQIVQGEGLTSITVSNPNDTAQTVEYSLSAPDGTVFQSGEELLEPNQTLTLDVEGTPGVPGAARVLAPLPLTAQSLTDLSSLVDTPVFGAPGVEPNSSWTLPYENPAGAAPASGSPAGGGVTRETGVAIHNVGDEINTCTFTAFEASGEPADSADREYQPGQQEALFVSQIFENLASSSGLLAVDCQSAVAMVGAIQDSNGAIVLTPANPD